MIKELNENEMSAVAGGSGSGTYRLECQLENSAINRGKYNSVSSFSFNNQADCQQKYAEMTQKGYRCNFK